MAPGTLIAGRYCVRRRLGAGGMGEVWLADDQEASREVALKVVRGDQERAPFAQRLAREAALLRSFEGLVPRVPEVYEHGRDGDLAFIAMRMNAGDTLEARLAREGLLPDDVAIDVALQVAETLRRAHERRVVHRDLKPDNILLMAPGDGSCAVVVLDWGIARAADSAVSPSLPGEGLVGTAAYMSPEALLGTVESDPAVDLWALSVVFYEMVTGQLPWAGRSDSERVRHIVLGETLPPESRRRGLSEPFERFFADSLAPDPSRRPRDAAAMIERLETLAAVVRAPLSSRHMQATLGAGETGGVTLAPPPLAPPARGRRSTWASAAVVAALILALVGAFWLAARDRPSIPHGRAPDETAQRLTSEP